MTTYFISEDYVLFFKSWISTKHVLIFKTKVSEFDTAETQKLQVFQFGKIIKFWVSFRTQLWDSAVLVIFTIQKFRKTSMLSMSQKTSKVSENFQSLKKFQLNNIRRLPNKPIPQSRSGSRKMDDFSIVVQMLTLFINFLKMYELGCFWNNLYNLIIVI